MTTEAVTGANAPAVGPVVVSVPSTGGDRQTVRVIGGEGTTSSGSGPGFGVVAALLALVASALLAARRR
jgi:PGF-CTERM protein